MKSGLRRCMRVLSLAALCSPPESTTKNSVVSTEDAVGTRVCEARFEVTDYFVKIEEGRIPRRANRCSSGIRPWRSSPQRSCGEFGSSPRRNSACP